MMDLVFFATAWGPLHGGINAFNHDLSLALAKALPKPGRVFCVVLKPDRTEVQDAADGGVTLISIDRNKSSDRMDPDWVRSLQKPFEAHGGVPKEACWVGHDVISGELAKQARQDFGGRCALIHHMRYGAYAPVKAFEGEEANAKLVEQEALFGATDGCALFGVGPFLQRSCRELAGREPVMLIPGFCEARTNTSTDETLRAITFGRLGSADDRIKLGLLAARGFAWALDKNACEPKPERCLTEASMFALGLSGNSQEEAEFRALAAPPSGRAVNVVRLAYRSRKDVFDRLEKSNLCLMLSWHEGFGLTAWEALAHEVPLVISRNSGAYQLIEETLGQVEVRGLLEALDIQGFTADPNNLSEADTKAVQRAIELVASNLVARKAAARKLKARLQEELGCTWQGTADAFLAGVNAVRLGAATLTLSANPSAPSSPIGPKPAPSVRRAGPCTGRDDDIAELLPLLLNSPALLLNGPGGMGKTTLARQLAHDTQVVARFGELRHEAELAPALTADALQAAIARAVGADPALGFEATLRALAGGPRLLLLDNLESPWDARDQRDAVAETLGRLGEVPGLVLLATLRGADVPPQPSWLVREVSELAPEDAKALFVQISRLRESEPFLTEFLGALKGLPLGITLVARRAQGLDGGLKELWEEWQTEGVKAARNPHASQGDARHASLAACIEFSLKSQRLTPTGKRLFSWLGALPAGLGQEDRRALQGESDATTATEQLVAVGLAYMVEGRLDLLPPIRRHADTAYRPKDKPARQWVEHFLNLTAGFGQSISAEGGRAVTRLVPEIPNLEAALRNAAADPALRRTALRAVWTYRYICQTAGQGGAALGVLAKAFASVGERRHEAHCIYGLADIFAARSDYAAARSGYEKALLLFRAVGNRLGEAHCILGLAGIDNARSDYAAARSSYEKALLLYRAVGDRLGEANCIQGLAKIDRALSDHAAARSGCENALLLFRALGDRLGEANCIVGLAEIDQARSDHAAARSGFDEALLLYRAVGNRMGEANCVLGLAEIDQARSDYAAARSSYEKALLLYRAMGHRVGEAKLHPWPRRDRQGAFGSRGGAFGL